MPISRSYLDEIRTRILVSRVVGKRVKLRKQGAEFVGLSPFKKERTASFKVNDRKMMWFDFSANRSGDIFDFVMETESVTFVEAVKRLASEAGMGHRPRDDV